ncbi:oxidoreductase [Mycolicibacterium madagascariense]|uniref:Oxidoreductase n=1 Tax=Mycolicibacterium madagascariense TaxID=212765 RepID=A0A7I7XN93_9MYCO|nr:aldo/keto reductase [Mycolicibacterium madagascariense]MCV7010876.1 aldo/keto reductase [Mycolicibacterium madagascariense]BBZ30573.1 oxidoreductase [Mycolicibacterium madagascariense]
MRADDPVRIRDVAVTRLGLGTAPLGGLFDAVSSVAAHATIEEAHRAGIAFFDTAPLYGYGVAERRLGEVLVRIDRGAYAVETKVGRLLRTGADPAEDPNVDAPLFGGEPLYKDTGEAVPVFDFSYDAAMRSIEESLDRLGLDRVDIVHVHDPDDYVDAAIEGACRAMCALREQGVVGAVGIATDFTETAVRVVREADVDCALIAGRTTLLDHGAVTTLLPLAYERGVDVIAASVFNSGILADPWRNLAYAYAPASPEHVQRARRMSEVCAGHDVPLAAAALQFSFRHPAVVSVLVGCRTPEEVRANVDWLSLSIPEELWSALDRECGVPQRLVPSA